MTVEELVEKYIASTETVFSEMRTMNDKQFDRALIEGVLEHAKAYLNDAKYYREKGEFSVSLTSIAYCEGLLDALRMIGAIEYQWPLRKGKEDYKERKF